MIEGFERQYISLQSRAVSQHVHPKSKSISGYIEQSEFK